MPEVSVYYKNADPDPALEVLHHFEAHDVTLADHLVLRERRVKLMGIVENIEHAIATMPEHLKEHVLGVFGHKPPKPVAHTYFHRAEPHAASYTPAQVMAHYNPPANYTGTGICVGIIELGGGYDTATLQKFFGANMPKITAVSVDGATNTPTGSVDSADGEVCLDIEIVGAGAPGASIVVYFAPNTDQGFIDAISAALNDETNNPQVISISWGGPENEWEPATMTTMDSLFAEAIAAGKIVTVATGDAGASDGEGGLHVDFPGSSPHVLACGGTTWNSTEIAWSNGGGGYSTVFPIPVYQTHSTSGRGTPDVAGDADPSTGYEVVVDSQSVVFGGTSCVAPLWAAMLARIMQALGTGLGANLWTVLYSGIGTVTTDITSGSNGGYNAGIGWDPCTGCGVPNGTGLLTALQGAPAPVPPPAPTPAPVPPPAPVNPSTDTEFPGPESAALNADIVAAGEIPLPGPSTFATGTDASETEENDAVDAAGELHVWKATSPDGKDYTVSHT